MEKTSDLTNVIQLTNGDLAVELTAEHLERAGLKAGDRVLWNPSDVSFRKYKGSYFDFLIGEAMLRVQFPAGNSSPSDLVRIIIDAGGQTLVQCMGIEEFNLFAEGIARMNREISLTSEIVNVQA